MSILFWKDKVAWKQAARNTFTCLIGCSIGDFSTIIIAQYFFPMAPVMPVMGIAMVNGLITSILLESSILKFREGFIWKAAIKMAFQMSFISMLAMELAENTTDYLLTGGGRVPTHHFLYWLSLCAALLAGYLVPLPYNYYKFKKYGKSCCVHDKG